MPLSQVSYETLRANPAYSACTYLMPAYEWLAEQIGFFPHFLSVGKDEYAIRRTGYPDQWMVRDGGDVVDGEYRKNYRKKGEFPNTVLFSFDHLEGIFIDYNYWHIALNTCPNGRSVTKSETKWILKPSWTRQRWLRAALTRPVDLVVPELPLEDAARVRVRNCATKGLVEAMGFRNVEVVRTLVKSKEW